MAAHAILSASSAYRWTACTPSARLEENYENTSSVFAAEGTLAHELGELKLRHMLQELGEVQFIKSHKEIEKHELFSPDMPDYVDIYRDTCMEKLSAARSTTADAVCHVEQRLDFSSWVPEGFGTGDFVIIADGTLEVVDLKYGKGVPVSAEDNIQMRLYALGAISQFEFLYDIEKVRMTIVQPRLDSISTDEISAAELLAWADEFIKPKAELAFKGEGEFCAGSHCGFCRAKAVCRARAEHNLELAKFEFAAPLTLENTEIAEILARADELTKWASDIQTFALEQAVAGHEFPGWKVVEGRSNRKYSDAGFVHDALMAAGYEEKTILKEPELLTLTNMEKLVGKKKLTDLIGHLIEKPPGKPVLVVESDKRQPFNTPGTEFGAV